MGTIFKNDLHDEFGSWPLGYISAGGLDFGEILTVAAAVGDGDDAAFYDAWVSLGDRLSCEAERSLQQGHRTTAREMYLRSSCAYATAYHPIYGAPVDPRLVSAFQRQVAAFDRGLGLSDRPVTPFRIPFEHTTLPGYLIPAIGRETEKRPLLIFTNGYDASITDLYFASAVAASHRGYHSLLFDGPGQGEMLIEQAMPLRPDWENVIRPVIDFALTLPIVDGGRIVLSGWSLGGYLATRAASAEPRLAACVADPGLRSVAAGYREFVVKMGVDPKDAADLGHLPESVIEKLWQIVVADRQLRWSIVQRGFWVNGTGTLRDYLRSIQTYTMEGREKLIQCPTLFTQAEEDSRATEVEAFFDELTCPKKLLKFTTNEGAGDHCEMKNRSLVNLRILDWLDGVLGGK